MEEIALSAERRTIIGKQVRQLRRDGLVPMTLYGHKTKAEALQVSERDLAAVLNQAGTNQLVNLKIGGKGRARKVLVREIQRDVVTRNLLHVDLYVVVMSEKISTELPIILLNESPAMKEGLGILIQEMTVLRVECLPGDLIPVVEIDISGLVNLYDSVVVGDLDLGDAIESLERPEEVIVRVVPLAVAEVEEVEEIEELGEELEEGAKGEMPAESEQQSEE